MLKFNKLAVDVFNTRLTQANLVTKTDFDAKLLGFNRKITKNKTDHLLVKNELTALKNKIPDVSSLVKKTDYNTRVAEIDTKVSNFDGKITKNKNDLKEMAIGTLLLFSENLMFDGEGVIQAAYLKF